MNSRNLSSSSSDESSTSSSRSRNSLKRSSSVSSGRSNSSSSSSSRSGSNIGSDDEKPSSTKRTLSKASNDEKVMDDDTKKAKTHTALQCIKNTPGLTIISSRLEMNNLSNLNEHLQDQGKPLSQNDEKQIEKTKLNIEFLVESYTRAYQNHDHHGLNFDRVLRIILRRLREIDVAEWGQYFPVVNENEFEFSQRGSLQGKPKKNLTKVTNMYWGEGIPDTDHWKIFVEKNRKNNPDLNKVKGKTQEMFMRYFTNVKLRNLTAAICYKLADGFRQLQFLSDHVKQFAYKVFKGPNKSTWKMQLCLPQEFQASFPINMEISGSEDDEQNDEMEIEETKTLKDIDMYLGKLRKSINSALAELKENKLQRKKLKKELENLGREVQIFEDKKAQLQAKNFAIKGLGELFGDTADGVGKIGNVISTLRRFKDTQDDKLLALRCRELFGLPLVEGRISGTNKGGTPDQALTLSGPRYDQTANVDGESRKSKSRSSASPLSWNRSSRKSRSKSSHKTRHRFSRSRDNDKHGEMNFSTRVDGPQRNEPGSSRDAL